MTRKTVGSTPAPGRAVKQLRQESEADFKKLQHLLDSYFDLREQDDLCTALRIDSPRVPGQTKKGRAANLIKAVAKADRLPELIALIKQERPFLSGEIATFNLPEHSSEFSLDFINGEELPFVRSTRLAEQLAAHLKVPALPDLCYELELDYENLGGLNHLENVQNLVSIIESQDRMDVLLAYLSQKWPSIQWTD